MPASAIYYVRSGRVGVRALLYIVFAGGLGVVVLAALYAVVIRYNPFVYFSFLATLIFGTMIGIAGSMAAQAGHSRSMTLICSVRWRWPVLACGHRG